MGKAVAAAAMQRKMGMLVNRKAILAAAVGLVVLAGCNHNTQGADNVISVADNKADAMQDNASAMRDEASNMGGMAGNAMDNAAAALDNHADQVRSDAGNKADALNKAVKN
jgi:hypothetical protein